MAFSENGYYLGSGAEGGGARIWDLRKLKCTKTLECTYLQVLYLCILLFFSYPSIILVLFYCYFVYFFIFLFICFANYVYSNKRQHTELHHTASYHIISHHITPHYSILLHTPLLYSISHISLQQISFLIAPIHNILQHITIYHTLLCLTSHHSTPITISISSPR